MTAFNNENDIRPTEPKPEFHITTDACADWYLSKLAAYDAEIALLKAQVELAVSRLQSDKTGLMNLYHAELEQYIAAKIADDKRGRKSVILPHGTCAFRTVPAGLKLTDADAALAFASTVTALELTRRELVTTAYNAYAERALRDQGELLPGMAQVPAHESFSLKFGK